ncbi:hypothetical protein PBY51_014302 [Eleginops maclovinus]|nr:hypothetical protein PBY51_014302 [Eleginops maclovinus]
MLQLYSHCPKECTVTKSHFSNNQEKSQETELFRDHLSLPLNSSPLLGPFFPPSSRSPPPLMISSTALLGNSIYHRFCLLGSAITDPVSKEHHSPPAISAYPLLGRARRNSARRRMKTAE